MVIANGQGGANVTANGEAGCRWSTSGFLLDRLLQYENVVDESSDSGATASSENSECEGPKPLDTPVLKKKRSPQLGGSASPSPSSLTLQPTLAYPHSQTPTPTQSPYLSSMTSPTFSPFPSEYLSSYPNTHAPGATAAGGASSVKPDKIKREKRAKTQKNKRAKLRVPLHSSHPESVTMSFSSPSDPLSTLSSKLPPTTILSTVPHQMFSDTGEGSDDDAMEGDDDLVIDIPE
ncbi:INO80 complex subunit E [Hemiscyllium ocellatum]|uniref:INO80 complex subunit E n=1 Tax=Hemiscyllium ocellatum TaxID=170820 RepID=UPI0029665FAD|nr:INO80 complex subunit E [Hemiscyllium ocellatum]